MTRKVRLFITRTIIGLLVTTAVLCLGILMCTEGRTDSNDDGIDTICSYPHTLICLQPFDDFTQEEAQALKSELKKKISEMIIWDFEIVVLPNKHLIKDLMNDTKTRYRATKIIRSLMKTAKKGTTVIGLTHKDISATVHGVNDFGVMGLSFRPGTACVVSTYRIKPKDMLWKVVTHEFCHTFFGISHCESGDWHCIMQDAKGRNPLKRETKMCKECKQKIS